MTSLILASTSPRRRELLSEAGIVFTIVPPHPHEAILPRNGCHDHLDYGRLVVRSIALEKARSIERPPRRLVLGADTLVMTEEGDILGQPRDRGESEAMIRRLAGRRHYVHTAVALIGDGAELCRADTAIVRFRCLNEAEIADYVASGEGDDKAGAYGYQGLGRKLVESVEGDEQTVIGLPIKIVREMMAEFDTGALR